MQAATAMAVVPGTYPASEGYVHMIEMQNKFSSGWNSYDQYEIAVPLDKVSRVYVGGLGGLGV